MIYFYIVQEFEKNESITAYLNFFPLSQFPKKFIY